MAAGGALVVGAAIGYLVQFPPRLIDTMIAEACEDAHDFSGFIMALGFAAAFVIVKAGI
jgi:hypothetical protein